MKVSYGYNFENILLTPKKSIVPSRGDVNTAVNLGNNTFEVPVVASNMPAISSLKICSIFDKHNWFYVYPRVSGPTDVLNFVSHANREFNITSISVGIKPEWTSVLHTIKNHGFTVDYITIDVANFYADYALAQLRVARELFPNSYIIVGNGCTGEWVNWVEEQGLANCVKVGIGVSKACRTRQFTGFGSTTVTSLSECVNAANTGIDIISDGGITVKEDAIWIGDIAKALVFGADFVMSGALFSRCVDVPAFKDGYYGNASRKAKGDSRVEGEILQVESSKLTVLETMKLVKESLQSSVSYCGGKHIYDLYGADYTIV